MADRLATLMRQPEKEKKVKERIQKCEKKEIKNGMYFKYKGRYYVKIDTKCVEINVNSSILFKEIEPEEIEVIFNSNGTLKM